MYPDKNEQNLAAALAIAERLPGLLDEIGDQFNALNQALYEPGEIDEKRGLLNQILRLTAQEVTAVELIDASWRITSYFPPENPHWLS